MVKNHNSEIKISVIMPAYNVKRYINKCIDSVISQTIENIEIIIIDDGSTDGCSEIIDEYAKKDSRIKVIHKVNAGYGAAINTGIENAVGEYIGIIETDDKTDIKMFENLYSLAVKFDADVVKSNYYNYWEFPEEKIQFYENIASRLCQRVINPTKEQIVFTLAPSVWSAIYRRSMIEKNNIRCLETEGASYQDTSFSFKVWVCAERVYFTHDAFIYYRQDNENSSVTNRNKVFCICDELHEIERFLAVNNRQDLLEIKNVLKYIRYYWNFRRLSPFNRYRFYKIFHQEVKEAYRKNEISEKMFSRSNWNNYLKITKQAIWYPFRYNLKELIY